MSQEHTERPEGKVQTPADASADRRSLRLRLRADRVAWVGIWALSVFLIVVYLVDSFSGQAASEVDSEVESFSPHPLWPPTAGAAGDLLEPSSGHSSPTVQHSLAQWADSLGVWLSVDLYPQNSAEHQEESVPIMLRIENAVPGSIYALDIRYDCAHRGGYDLLNSYGLGGSVTPALYTNGPGTSIPDATLVLPDALASGLDGAADDPTFKLWGGSFTSAAPRPSAVDICLPGQGSEVGKEYALAFTAWSETVFLLWNGHLAPYMDLR
jgi:hypothetical protein